MRCRECKDKFEPKYFNQKYCLENLDCIAAFNEWVKQTKEKEQKKKWAKEKKEKMPVLYPTKYKNLLQSEMNKLARMIDTKFNYKCIDCDTDFGKQSDGSHFHNVQGNENIRFNLHNIHKSRSDCNQYHGGRKKQYTEGLIKRYGKKYLNYVDIQMKKDYPYLGLSSKEIGEKLTIVRKLVRDFDTFHFTSSLSARIQLNKLIGIYTINPAEIDLIINPDEDILNQQF